MTAPTPPVPPVRLAILASGGGSNLQAILDHFDALGDSRAAEVVLVASNRADAGALARARARNIPAAVIANPADGPALVNVLESHRVDCIALAGYLKFVPAAVTERWHGRIVNVHPSLLPSFPGLEAWKQALDHGVKVTGCTVHFVDAGVDSGAIIGQQTVPVLDHDTAESLHARIHAAEHELYPKCVAAVARGEISVQGRRVVAKKN